MFSPPHPRRTESCGTSVVWVRNPGKGAIKEDACLLGNSKGPGLGGGPGSRETRGSILVARSELASLQIPQLLSWLSGLLLHCMRPCIYPGLYKSEWDILGGGGWRANALHLPGSWPLSLPSFSHASRELHVPSKLANVTRLGRKGNRTEWQEHFTFHRYFDGCQYQDRHGLTDWTEHIPSRAALFSSSRPL